MAGKKTFKEYMSGKTVAAAGLGASIALNAGGSAVVASFPNVSSARDYAAKGDGVAIENTSFAALYANASEIFVDAGQYKFSAQVDLSTKDARIILHPEVMFLDHAWNMQNLLTVIGPSPSVAFDAFYKDVTADYDMYAHVVGQSVVTKASTNGVTVVSMFANCEVSAAGSHGFGLNVGAYITGAGTGIVAEFDSHVTDPAGLGYAVVIDSVGSYASQAAIVIQPNGPNSPFLTGISFNNASGNDAITNNAIQFLNAGEAACFLFAHADMMFSSAVIETNTFIAGPSVVGATALLRVDASASGSPKLSAVGSATNAGVLVQGKGTSGGGLVDGASNTKMAWNTTGVGFFNTTPVAKQTVTGSKVANAALSSLISALAAYGIITDSSS